MYQKNNNHRVLMSRFLSILILSFLFSGNLTAQVADSWFHTHLLGMIPNTAAGRTFDIEPISGNGYVTAGYEIDQATNRWEPMATRIDNRGNLFLEKNL